MRSRLTKVRIPLPSDPNSPKYESHSRAIRAHQSTNPAPERSELTKVGSPLAGDPSSPKYEARSRAIRTHQSRKPARGRSERLLKSQRPKAATQKASPPPHLQTSPPSNLQTFKPSHLHTFTPSNLQSFNPSNLQTPPSRPQFALHTPHSELRTLHFRLATTAPSRTGRCRRFSTVSRRLGTTSSGARSRGRSVASRPRRPPR